MRPGPTRPSPPTWRRRSQKRAAESGGRSAPRVGKPESNRILKRGVDVLVLEVRIVPENLSAVGARREKLENVGHANAQPPKTGASATLFWVDCYALKLSHGCTT